MRSVEFCIIVTAVLLSKSRSLSTDRRKFLPSTRSSPRCADLPAQRVASVVGDIRRRRGGCAAAASSARYDGRSNEPYAEDDGSRWKIWSVIEELEANGTSSSSSGPDDAIADILVDDGRVVPVELTNRVIRILRQWGQTWAGRREWQTLLNKKSLLHEVEESIVALHFLLDWLESRNERDRTPVTLVDVCCGKGIMSTLASYLFCDMTSTHVSSIIMLDKQRDINWSHIVSCNESAQEEGRPIIKTWGGCNLHDVDNIVERLEAIHDESMQDTECPVALVGIHLCNLLSPACVGIVNSLGPEKCPFLCLAPCCLPRVVRDLCKPVNVAMIPKKSMGTFDTIGNVLPIRIIESEDERRLRKVANQRRDGAKKRTFVDLPCYLCSEMHPIHKCNLLPSDENERLEIFQRAAGVNPCWKCGEIGHFRKDCPGTELASKPRLTLPPTMYLDVSSILQRDYVDEEIQGREETKCNGPFERYCHLLGTAVQRDSVKVFDAGFVNSLAQHNNAANHDNWNRDRKSIFIIASSSSN